MHAFIVLDMPAVRGDNPDGLCCILRRAATDGDQIITALRIQESCAVMDIFTGRVRFDFIIQGILNSRFIQYCQQFAGYAALDQKFVGDHKRLLQLQFLNVRTNLLQTAFSHNVGGRNIIDMSTH
ncbi:hypothetical protein D3C73_940420 [compost metagenome]